MPLSFNNFNFNQLKTINAATNAADLKGKDKEIQNVKVIFAILISSKDPLDNIEFSFIQKVIYIIKPLFFYIYFDNVILCVNLKINAFAKTKLAPFDWKNVNANENETVEDII